MSFSETTILDEHAGHAVTGDLSRQTIATMGPGAVALLSLR